MTRLLLITTGGTIAMSAGPGGGATLQGSDLMASSPELVGLAEWRVLPLLAKPSASLTFDDLIALKSAVEAADEDGVVITHGTDTLEETAFFLELTLPTRMPVVVTGAMRPATQAGADGPANLIAAARTVLAASPGRVLVVMGDEIHWAGLVRKAHTSRPHAFSSAPLGPLGWIIEGRPRLMLAPVPIFPRLAPGPLRPEIPILEAGLGFSPSALIAAATGAQGLVLSLPGGGHLAASALDAVRVVARDMPVVMASRTGAGEMLRGSYGYAGSETDLAGRGLISAGVLDPTKARILLWLLLSQGRNPQSVAQVFAAAPIGA